MPGAEGENLAPPRIGVLVGHWGLFHLNVWAGWANVFGVSGNGFQTITLAVAVAPSIQRAGAWEGERCLLMRLPGVRLNVRIYPLPLLRWTSFYLKTIR